MMKLLKRIFIGLLTLIILAAFALWLLTKTLNPETVKNYINNRLTSLTHKPSHINGSINWQLFPRPGIKVTDIKVGDKQQNKDYSLSIAHLLFNLKMTPLLRGQIVFSDVTVDGLTLNADLNQINSVKPAKSADSTQPAKTGMSKTAETFVIERLMLTRGQLYLKQKEAQLTVSDLQLGMEQFNLVDNTPFPIQIKAKLSRKQGENSLSMQLNYKGKLSLPIGNEKGLLKQMAVTGQLIIEKIKYNQFRINSLHTNLKKVNNDLLLNPLTLSFYNGKSVGDLRYKIDKQIIEINQTATNLDSQSLFAQLLGYDIVNGTMDYSIHAQLPLRDPALNKLTANGQITIKNGALLGVDLNGLVQKTSEKLTLLIQAPKLALETALNLLKFSPGVFSQGTTPFKLATLQFHLTNAELKTDSLLIQSDKLMVEGSGILNLQTYAINSRLQATLTSENENATAYAVQQLLGGSYPVTVSGNLQRPIVLPDIKIINNIIRNVLIKNALEQPVKEIGNQIKSLFQ